MTYMYEQVVLGSKNFIHVLMNNFISLMINVDLKVES